MSQTIERSVINTDLPITKRDLIEQLAVRAGMPEKGATRPAIQHELRRWRTTDLYREWIVISDTRRPDLQAIVNRDPAAVRSAVSGGAVGEYFDAAAGAAVMAGFGLESDNTAGWTTTVPALDFQDVETFLMESMGTLHKLPRGGTAEHADIRLSEETWSVARYAAAAVIDAQDLVDDKLVRLQLLAVRQMGAAARRLIPDMVFAKILENPTLATDSTAVFHANHSNLGTAALAEASLEAAIAAIGNYTYRTTEGQPVHVNARPYALIVPPDLAGEARKLVRVIKLDDGNDIKVLAESRLSATGVVDPASGRKRVGTATNWLLVAARTAFPCCVVGGLDNSLAPDVRPSDLERGQWGRRYDIVSDVGAAIVDYRGLYFSTGAA